MVPEMMDVIVKTLTRDRERARELVESVIDSERHYLFTNDREYKESRQSIVRPGTDTMTMPGDMRDTGNNNPRDMMNKPPDMGPRPTIQRRGGGDAFVNEVRIRIDMYFDIVLRSIKDQVPKMIGYFLVKKSQDSLQFELYNTINTNMNLAKSLGEPARVTERRKALTDVISVLKNSIKVLQRETEYH